MSDLVKRLHDLAACKHDDLSIAKEAADEIDRLRAENELLTAENKKWQEHDDAIRAEFGYKRDGRATIECLRETFAAKWSEEDTLFQATLDMKTKELRAENERLNKSRNKWGQKYNKLLKKHKVTLSQLKTAVWSDSEECKMLTAEIDRLRAALEGEEPSIVT